MKNILVLGAGFVAEPLVEYLNRRSENSITVASYLLEEAEQLASKFEQVEAIQLDVTNQELITNALSEYDLVVSLVPAPFHPTIAKAAIDAKVSMVTASYESNDMRALADDIEAAGIVVLNEIGLDPGIDHLSAMQIIEEAQAKGDSIETFVSWCGGLPAPEFNNNPLGYKFSWAPKGVLTALLNEAKYLREYEAITVSSENLMDWAKPLTIADLSLEGYPNRESISYKDVYGIGSVASILRGTLRYQGFSEIIKGAYQLGLLSMQKQDFDVQSWKDFVLKINQVSDLEKLKATISDHAVAALEWLGCFSESTITQKNTPIDVFCELLIEKLKYLENETDMVVLQHKFVAQKNNGEEYFISSTLKAIGDIKGYSAMSKTVGYPAAIASQLILDGVYKGKGLKLPVTKDMYEPVLAALAKEGIVCEEQFFTAKEVDKKQFLSELN
ncbi:MAG: saccharopine dehydrogenase NADP-binding domain-containing protein [Gammaproteobacteria bacterium]|nr:saccharopine dehydrogenase NADP-binding domain-containing protein [Gammaproteobacteria bacterium]